jgi:hypothetical protein
MKKLYPRLIHFERVCERHQVINPAVRHKANALRLHYVTFTWAEEWTTKRMQ